MVVVNHKSIACCPQASCNNRHTTFRLLHHHLSFTKMSWAQATEKLWTCSKLVPHRLQLPTHSLHSFDDHRLLCRLHVAALPIVWLWAQQHHLRCNSSKTSRIFKVLKQHTISTEQEPIYLSSTWSPAGDLHFHYQWGSPCFSFACKHWHQHHTVRSKLRIITTAFFLCWSQTNHGKRKNNLQHIIIIFLEHSGESFVVSKQSYQEPALSA
jgi:hypothetical protein